MITPAAPELTCDFCLKPKALCVCEGLEPVATKLGVLILQHPQEQDVDLGTARIAARALSSAVLRVGLSWPNLPKALGRAADPKKWAVLYLGSTSAAKDAPGQEVVAVDKKGQVLPNQPAQLSGLEGVILLDGTWSQAKAIWWRNAWFLKCRRLVLCPTKPSRYGKLRKEPRKDGLSTLESIGVLMAHLEKRPDVQNHLLGAFDRLLAKYRALRDHKPLKADQQASEPEKSPGF
jgi:DTW domain-containing protein